MMKIFPELKSSPSHVVLSIFINLSTSTGVLGESYTKVSSTHLSRLSNTAPYAYVLGMYAFDGSTLLQGC